MLPLIPLTETLFIPSYILIISITYSICIVWMVKRAQAQHSKMNVTTLLDLCLAIMVGGFLGARGFHIIYESPSYYWSSPLEILKFWKGGFVFYGGALGALLASLWVLQRKGERFTPWADFFAPILAFGYALGRIACFANGCCFGSVCNWPWAIAFPRAGAPYAEELLRHPTQLYATTWELGVCLILLALERPRRRQRWIRGWLRPTGSLFFLWVVLHSLGRLVMEWFRDDFRGLHPLGLSISSWLSLLFIALALLWFRKIKR